uniref:Ribosomal RNA-processing protein 42 n=1 Tax=Macrostomum lignano TaxID=282301 RepID=A0A1I8IX72_9PLAT
TRQLLSEPERQYIFDSVQDAVRIDGRQCLAYRQAALRLDLLCYATASAQVSLGETDVLVSVREEDNPGATAQQQGSTGSSASSSSSGPVSVWVDCSCLGSGPEQQQLADEAQAHLSSLYRCLRTPTPVFVDILLLGYDGDLLDAASIAASAALMRALPASLLSAQALPLFATVHRIGSQQIVDANQLEESCSMARVTVGVDSNGRLVACQTCGEGSLQFESMTEMIETGVRKAMMLHDSVAKLVARVL